jgi:hypothetical protein
VDVRAILTGLIAAAAPVTADAGTLIGKVELPAPPERPAPASRGFLDRVENSLAPVKPYSVTNQLVIVLEGGETAMAPPQVTWDLVGESFARPVIAAAAGAEIVIRNSTKTARTLSAKEDGKLIPAGPINPKGTKSFRASDAGKVYTISDSDSPHLRGTLVVVTTTYVGYPDEGGTFEINDVPAGSYRLRIWYRDHWLDRPDDAVEIKAKGKTDVNPKVPAGFPVKK